MRLSPKPDVHHMDTACVHTIGMSYNNQKIKKVAEETRILHIVNMSLSVVQEHVAGKLVVVLQLL